MKFTKITLREKNIRDFARARNLAMAKAKTDWVLFIDSDETVSAELAREIKALKPDNYSGFYLKRKNYFLGQDVGTDKILRLARKDAGRWQRRVHEIWKIKGKVGILKNFLIHRTADSVGEMLVKVNFYSTLHSQANLEEGKRSNLLKIILWPVLKFGQSFFSGRGVLFSFLQSFHSFLGWAKLWLIQKKS